MKGRFPVPGVLAGLALALAWPATQAQTTTWTSTSSGQWGTAGNWSSGVPTSPETVVFNNSAGLATGITLLPSSDAGSLSFSSSGGANAYTFDTAATANNNTLTIGSGISNSENAGITFYNAVTLSAAQSWTNNGGILTFDGNVNLGVGSSGGSLSLVGSGAIAIAGVVADGGSVAGQITYSGTGSLTLSGSNTYTGGTILSGGILNVRNNAALGTGSATVSSGTTLQVQGGLTNLANAVAVSGSGATSIYGSPLGAIENVSGNNTISGAVTLNGATLINSDSGTLSVTTGGITGSGANLMVGGLGNTAISGVIATGAGSLTKAGTGTLTLSGANTYTGSTTISGGILSISADSNLGASPSSILTGDLSFAGGTLATTSTFTLNGNRGILLGSSGGTIDVASGTTLTYGGAMAGSGALTVADSGTLLLNAANSYGGKTTINSGATLQLGDGTNVGTITSSSSVTDNGTLVFDEATNGGPTLAPFSKAISGTGGVTQGGSATMVLSGTNSYSGATVINSATLMAGSTSAFGGATGLSAVTVNNSGTLSLSSYNNTVGSIASSSGTSSISLGSSGTGATLTTGGNSTSTTFAGVISGTGGLVEAGTGTLTLNNAETFTGKLTINSGAKVQLGDGTNNGSLSTSSVADSGTLILNEGSASTISTQISGSGAVTQNGSVNTTLSGANVYSGATTVTSGTLTAGSTAAFGGPNGLSAVTVNNSGILALNGFNNTVGSIASSGLTTNSAIQLGSATLTSGGNNTSTSFAGVVSGSGGLAKAGTGTLTLSGVNTYTGTTTISGGAIAIGADSGLGAAPGTPTSSQLALNGGALDTTASFTLNANRGISLGSGGGTLSANPRTTLTVAGTISGAGALTLAGSGNTVLSGTNTYTGATNFNGGTTSISSDSNLGAPPTVAKANLLNFNGGGLATTSSLTLNANRGISVGSSGGTISLGTNTTLNYGGLVAGTGTLSLLGTGTLNLTSGALNFGGGTTVYNGSELEFSGTLPSVGTLTLGTGSTLFLNGSDLSVTNLVVTGNAIIDFGTSASILNSTNFTLSAGASLTVLDWTNEVDYFYSQNWTGATLGTRGQGSETQTTFNGYSSSSTGWLSYDNEISPAPEPATYGAILGALSLAAVGFRRLRRRGAA